MQFEFLCSAFAYLLRTKDGVSGALRTRINKQFFDNPIMQTRSGNPRMPELHIPPALCRGKAIHPKREEVRGFESLLKDEIRPEPYAKTLYLPQANCSKPLMKEARTSIMVKCPQTGSHLTLTSSDFCAPRDGRPFTRYTARLFSRRASCQCVGPTAFQPGGRAYGAEFAAPDYSGFFWTFDRAYDHESGA